MKALESKAFILIRDFFVLFCFASRLNRTFQLQFFSDKSLRTEILYFFLKKLKKDIVA